MIVLKVCHCRLQAVKAKVVATGSTVAKIELEAFKSRPGMAKSRSKSDMCTLV